MNFRPRLVRYCTTGCGLLLILCVLAIATPARAALVDPKIKSSPDADKPANKTLITAAVKSQVDVILSGPADKRAAAREALIVEINAAGGAGAVPFSTEFFNAYSQELNRQLMPLASDKDVVVRLNAAIVVARVAEKVDNSWMMPITLVFLGDKSDAVVDWGLKAARYILPPALQAGLPADQQKLIAAIKSHADDPMLLPLVYEALSLNYLTVKGNVPGRDKQVIQIVPEVLSVMNARLATYEKQVPPEPMAEVPATLFLSFPSTWDSLAKQAKLQVQVVQALSDLTGLAGQRAAVSQPPVRDQLENVVKQSASALSAIAIKENASAIITALQPLARLAPNNPQLPKLLSQVPAALKTNPAWASVKPAPTIQMSPTTSTATTAPVTAAK